MGNRVATHWKRGRRRSYRAAVMMDTIWESPDSPDVARELVLRLRPHIRSDRRGDYLPNIDRPTYRELRRHWRRIHLAKRKLFRSSVHRGSIRNEPEPRNVPIWQRVESALRR